MMLERFLVCLFCLSPRKKKRWNQSPMNAYTDRMPASTVGQRGEIHKSDVRHDELDGEGEGGGGLSNQTSLVLQTRGGGRGVATERPFCCRPAVIYMRTRKVQQQQQQCGTLDRKNVPTTRKVFEWKWKWKWKLLQYYYHTTVDRRVILYKV